MEAYLIKNAIGIYQFRRFVPQDLVVIVGKRELRRSLKTRCSRQAAHLCRMYAVECENYFRFLREQMSKKSEFDSWAALSHPKPLPPYAVIKNNQITVDPRFQELEDRIKASLAQNADAGAIVQPPSGSVETVFMSKIFTEYLKDRTAHKWTDAATSEPYVDSCNLWLKIVGDRTLASYTYRDAEAFRDGLLRVPPRWLRDAKLRSKSFKQVSSMAGECMHPSTAREHMRRIANFFAFAMARGLTDKQIFTDVFVRVEHSSYESFTLEELQKLFSWENFGRFQRRNKPSHYWVPLIALHSGMRMGEIFFLTVESVKKSTDGFWYFDIAQNVKNAHSIRPVPIHSKLLELGFLEFVESKTERLFSEYKDHKGQAGVKFTDAFARYRASCFDAEPRTKVFHSFRHTVAETLQIATAKALNPFMYCRLLGHKTGQITVDTYGGDYDVQQLHEIIELLEFSDVLSSIPRYCDVSC